MSSVDIKAYSLSFDKNSLNLNYESGVINLSGNFQVAANLPFFYPYKQESESHWVSPKIKPLALPKPNEDFLGIAIQVTIGLKNLHEQGYLAHELAPQTIAFDDEQAYYLIPPWPLNYDKVPERSNTETLLWTSPEQTGRTNRQVDQRSDLYSLGCIFYWLITREPPFTGSSEIDIISSHLSKPIELRGWEPLTLIVNKLTQKDPSYRYQSAKSVLRDLQYIAQRREAKIGKAWYPGRMDPGPELRPPSSPVGFDAIANRVRQFLSNNNKRAFLFIAGNPGAGKSFLVRKLLQDYSKSPFVMELKFELTQSMDLFTILKNSIARLTQQLNPVIIKELVQELKTWKEPESFFLPYFLPDSLLPAKNVENQMDADKKIAVSIFAFVEFLRLLCEKIQLVLFVDDLQWADSLFIRYINNLLNNSEVKRLHFIGTYRHNELDATNLFNDTLTEIQALPFCHHESLQPVNRNIIRKLISKMLGRYHNLENLAEMVYKYTEGNPFHAVQVILHLGEQGILEFQDDTWQVNSSKLEGFKLDERMQDLLLQRIHRCSDNAQSLLVIASMMAEFFTKEDLENYSDIASSDIASAVEELTLSALFSEKGAGLSFAHDKLREAAGNIVPQEQMSILARKIFMVRSRVIDSDSDLFQVVQIASRFYQTWPRTLKGQLADLAERCLSIAYNSALLKEAVNYANLALDCNYKDEEKLLYKKAEALYLLGNHEEVTSTLELIDQGYEQEKKDLILRSLAGAGLYQQAVDHGMKMLRDLGNDFPEEFQGSLILKQGRKLKEAFSIDDFAALLTKETLKDKNLLKTIEVIHIISPLAFFLNMTQSTWLQMELNLIHIQNGNSDYLGFSLMNYAAILCTMGDYDTGVKIGEMAMKHVDDNFPAQAPAVSHIYLNWVHHWGTPHHELKKEFLEKIQLAKRTGDAISVAYLVSFLGWHISFIHHNCAELKLNVQKYRPFLQQVNYRDGMLIFDCFDAYLSAMEKDADSHLPLTSELEQRLSSSEMKMQYVVYYIMSTRYCLIKGNFSRAQHFFEQATPYVFSMSSGIIMYDNLFLKILCRCGTISDSPTENELRELAKWLKRLEVMTNQCVVNFERRFTLASLAVNTVRGSFDVQEWASYLNDSGNAECGLNLMAGKLAYKFSKELKDEIFSAGIEAFHEKAMERYQGHASNVSGSGYNQIRDAGQKLLLAASGNALAENFLRVLMEQTGSTKAYFLQTDQSRTIHLAELHANSIQYEQKDIETIPKLILDFINQAELGETQQSNNKEWKNDFDKIIPTGSAISTSIKLGDRNLALIYFENSLLSDFFTEDRLGLIELLSGLAAIGMQNQQLLAEQQRINQGLEDKVTLRTSQFKEAKDKAEQALGKLQKSQEELTNTKAKASMNMLAAHLAHEVNNPLNYISTGYNIIKTNQEKYHDAVSEAIPDTEEAKGFRKNLEEINQKSLKGIDQVSLGYGKIAKVINEIRAITGIDGFHFNNLNLFDILYEEVGYVLARAHKSKENFDLRIDELLFPDRGDREVKILSSPAVIARSLRTVMAHGIHFSSKTGTSEKPTVKIVVDDNQDMTTIRIFNNGPSIKTKDISDIFDINKSDSYGTELIGLAMIKVLLNQVNADIDLLDTGKESGWVCYLVSVPKDDP